jgi:23S rRNA (cytosine1962-C5)-methyltransferase
MQARKQPEALNAPGPRSPGSPMAKPQEPRPATKRNAPKADKPQAASSPYARPARSIASAPKTSAHPVAPRNSFVSSNPSAKTNPIAKPKPRTQGQPAPAGNPRTTGKPGAIVSRRASDKLRSGHLWVYASDVESVSLPGATADAPPALLPVADSRGLLLGTALYSPASQIALRMISREALDEVEWLVLLAERLRQSIARRKPLLDAENDSCRLCFSEADELPGLVVDKYAGLVILQLLAKGLDSAAVRETCVRVLREELAPDAILERPDPRMRELEGLAAPQLEPLYVKKAKAPSATKFHLNGLVFQYDANSGQKTGAFLDQRTNYAAARDWAKKLGIENREGGGRALDVCCYQGGFALHLAQVCGQVTGIDASRASLEVAERNLEANRAHLTASVDWLEADAFQILRDWSDAGERFDAIVLDPPAFAKSKRAVEGALRGYKELNLRALKMLNPGGLLVTCSCSHHVSWTDLEGAVTSAAVDASRRVRLLERRGAALDHPVVLNLPETEYLKCLVLEVE